MASEQHETSIDGPLQGNNISEQEHGFQYQFLLLCAPSGYGKTTLLVDVARQSSIPCCWYMLDENDADAITFLQTLLSALQQNFTTFGSSFKERLAYWLSADEASLPSITDLLSLLDEIIDAIAEQITQRFLLILCNYQELSEHPQVVALISRLLERLPEQMAFIIESRAVPRLNFVSLLARRKMLGLGSSHLRLSPQEISELAHLQGVSPLSLKEALYLAETFDGWIAGILLGTRLGDVQLLQTTVQSQEMSRQEQAIVPINRQHLFSYLVNDVFGREPQAYQFLKEVSILQQMIPTICEQLLDIDHAYNRLVYLEEHGFFVSKYSEANNTVFICHPVLREILCETLRQVDLERFVYLHRKAAYLFQQAQEYDLAIYHAQQAQDDDLAARLISKAYLSLFNQGHFALLERWISHIPQDRVRSYPQLLLIQANLHLTHGEAKEALFYLEEAERLLDQPIDFSTKNGISDNEEEKALRIEIALARSRGFFLSGQYDQALSLCRLTLTWLATDEVRLRTEAQLRLGICLIYQGEVTASIQELQKALQLSRQSDQSHQKARLHSQLANAYHLIGNYALSDHHRTRAIRCWELLHDEQGKIRSLIATGIDFQRRGLCDESEKILLQTLESARKYGSKPFLQGEAYALVSLGELYQDQGKYDQALGMVEDGLTLARQLGDYYLTVYSLSIQAVTYVLMGDADTAHLLLAEITPSSAETNQDMSLTRALHSLAEGTILLYQHKYIHALPILSKVEQTFSSKSLKREQLQCLMRLSACAYWQNDTTSFLRYLELASAIMIQHDYEHVVRTELERLPNLLQGLLSLTGSAHLLRLKKDILRPLREILPQEHEEEPLFFPSASVTQQELERTAGAPHLLPTPISNPLEKTAGREQGETMASPPEQPTTLFIAETRKPQIQIRGFGEPIVLIDGQPVTRWRLARSMELFFFLLDRGEAIHKEQIMAALWSEDDEQIDQKFRSTLYYLRKVLGESCVTAQSGRYRLALTSTYDLINYDVAQFQQASEKVKLELKEHHEEEAYQTLSLMVELYRGDYVQSFYNDWCSFRRDELRRDYVNAHQQLALYAWKNERWDESVLHWQHVLAVDSYMEVAHFELMRCYLRQSKRGLAIRQYQRCATALQEIALTPGHALQRLYQRLLQANKTQQDSF